MQCDTLVAIFGRYTDLLSADVGVRIIHRSTDFYFVTKCIQWRIIFKVFTVYFDEAESGVLCVSVSLLMCCCASGCCQYRAHQMTILLSVQSSRRNGTGLCLLYHT